MKSVFEKIIEKLEENLFTVYTREWGNVDVVSDDTIHEIVNQAAEEYGDGWIPCSKEMPPQPEENPLFENKPLELYLVSIKNVDYPFRAFWNGENFTDGWCKLKATAWQPLPQPYQSKETEV